LDNRVYWFPKSLKVKKQQSGGKQHKVNGQKLNVYQVAQYSCRYRKHKEADMQQYAVTELFVLKIAEQAIYNEDGYNADNKKLQPEVVCVNKINNTKKRVQEYNCPDYIIGLIPRFF
jgi:hypothetical protein